MPPKPKAFTAARRGVRGSRSGHDTLSSSTRNGLGPAASSGIGEWKLAVGGSMRWRKARSTFINPAAPAAVSR